jgi:hypothetical protein
MIPCLHLPQLPLRQALWRLLVAMNVCKFFQFPVGCNGSVFNLHLARKAHAWQFFWWSYDFELHSVHVFIFFVVW